VVLAAAVVYLLPEGWLTSLQPAAPSASAAAPTPSTVTVVVPTNAASVAASAPGAAAVVEQAPSTPVATPAAAPATSAATSSAGPLRLHARAQSWVEVQDGASQVLLSRLVQPGETVVLDGAMPLRVTVGNALGTELVFRGQALDLAPNTRDNVARLELK
jgi:cytoskeleton protein RodZ